MYVILHDSFLIAAKRVIMNILRRNIIFQQTACSMSSVLITSYSLFYYSLYILYVVRSEYVT
jgi:hypothetical protein